MQVFATFALSSNLLFVMLFALTLIMFMFAFMRKTVGMFLFSSILWFGLSFSIWSVADPEEGLTQGASYIFLLLGIIMFVLTIVVAFSQIKENQKEQDRKVAEDVGI